MSTNVFCAKVPVSTKYLKHEIYHSNHLKIEIQIEKNIEKIEIQVFQLIYRKVIKTMDINLVNSRNHRIKNIIKLSKREKKYD